MAGPLITRQWPHQASRTAGRSCQWLAETTIGTQTYIARSRSGAPQALARMLVNAGVLDVPVRVESAGLRGCMAYRSLHAMAGWVYEETATVRLHRKRWEDPAIRHARIADAFRQGGAITPPPVPDSGSGLHPPKTAFAAPQI